jgi:hypothetical protein
VRLRELFKENVAKAAQVVSYGRAFNHPEHFVFFHGAEGALEALQHYQEVAVEPEGETTVRGKWDGNPQVYWGREVAGGPLILAGHNGWGKGGRNTGTTMDDFTSPEAVHNFILNKSGSPKTPQEVAERKRFADEFSSLYPIFDAATPADFVGFLYADALFLSSTKPKLDSVTRDPLGIASVVKEEIEGGVYNIHPNPKSKTVYHVAGESELGARIAQAQAMVVGHGTFDRFGAPDNEQTPKEDFSEFNQTTALIVQGPTYTSTPPKHDMQNVDKLKALATNKITQFTDSITKSDKNGIFYPFANEKSKQGQFSAINNDMLYQWMAQKGVSPKKVEAYKQLNTTLGDPLSDIWKLMQGLRNLKDSQHQSFKSMPRSEIWDSNGEGHVRYADPVKHKFGNVKFVPTSWTP